MELILAFAAAIWLIWMLAEEGWLGQDQERVWINYLAAKSRRSGDLGHGRRNGYARAGATINCKNH